ncbi:MAG: hypothetical protein K8R79_05995, partial [Calditrichales bacterium]|nr:hypothetical protein [Calditrichales bacterium]
MNYIKLVVRLLLALTIVGMLVFYVGCSKDEPFAPLDNAANASGEPEGIATPLFPDNIPDTPPVPESEIAELTFSETWLSENNKSDSPESFNITFPAKWLDESPKLAKLGKAAVKLRLPKKMIGYLDKNPDPNSIEIYVPRRWVYPDEIEADEEIDDSPEEKSGINYNSFQKSTDLSDCKQERRKFYKKDDNITGFEGYSEPSSNRNQKDYFTNYNETEIYFSGSNCDD